MGIDILTLGVGIFSFLVFFLVHGITFRWVRPEQLLKSLLGCVMAMMGLPLVLMAVLYVLKAADAGWQEWVWAGILALLIEGLLCLVYVLCVFGPYETSMRMRLVREIARGGQKGISLDELLGSYNDETIVNLRLQRLIGSGDIIEKDGRYRAGHKQNFFFIFDAIAGVLKKWIGGR